MFRFSFAAQFRADLPGAAGSSRFLSLDDDCRLPEIQSLDGSSAVPVKAGWNEDGLALSFLLPEPAADQEAARLALCLNLREAADMHRANRYCVQFCFDPFRRGGKLMDKVSRRQILQAREFAPTVDVTLIQTRRAGGELSIWLPAAVLPGYDPEHSRRLGWTYLITSTDRAVDRRSLSHGPNFPLEQDPSLWQTLELVR
jgi:hypothetical protein